MRTVGWLWVLSTMICLAGCTESNKESAGAGDTTGLVGAWRSTVQFSSGAFSGIDDLRFMYVFNVGGTLTESSNYDAAPPVPPAYGVWRKLSDRRYEAKYEFYLTRSPNSAEDSAHVSGWLPAGRGLFIETITLADDKQSFSSEIRYEAYDPDGRPADGGGDATGEGIRIDF